MEGMTHGRRRYLILAVLAAVFVAGMCIWQVQRTHNNAQVQTNWTHQINPNQPGGGPASP